MLISNSFFKDEKLISEINKSTVTNSWSTTITAAVISLSREVLALLGFIASAEDTELWRDLLPHGATTIIWSNGGTQYVTAHLDFRWVLTKIN